MRQLQERVSNRLEAISFPVFMPALDVSLRVLAEASPLGVDIASALLKKKGISSVEFHPECVIAAAIACRRSPTIQLQTIKKKTIVAAAAIRDADAILRVAYRQAHASGASNVGEVAAEMAADKIPVDKDAVRYVLREFSDVHFLEQEWFCHQPTNPERDRLRMVLIAVVITHAVYARTARAAVMDITKCLIWGRPPRTSQHRKLAAAHSQCG
jgi:hypothetical protein